MINDSKFLSNNKSLKDKYYVDLYNESKIVCVIDLINNYPSTGICFPGFFLMNKEYQNKHIGTTIFNEL